MFEKLSSHVDFKCSKASSRGTHIFQHDRLIYFRQIGSPSHRRKTRKFPLCYCHPQWANHSCLCDCTPKVCAVHLGRELNFKSLCQKFWNIVAAHHSVNCRVGIKKIEKQQSAISKSWSHKPSMLLHYRAGGLPALPELTAQWQGIETRESKESCRKQI